MVKLEYLQESDFWQDIYDYKLELILEVAKRLLIEIDNIKSKKRRIKIFKVFITDEYIIDFIIEKKESLKVLQNLLPHLIKAEEYEICSQIQKLISDECNGSIVINK